MRGGAGRACPVACSYMPDKQAGMLIGTMGTIQKIAYLELGTGI